MTDIGQEFKQWDMTIANVAKIMVGDLWHQAESRHLKTENAAACV